MSEGYQGAFSQDRAAQEFGVVAGGEGSVLPSFLPSLHRLLSLDILESRNSRPTEEGSAWNEF